MQCKDGQKHESAVWIHQLVSKVSSTAVSPRKPSVGIHETSCRFPKILDQTKICEEIQKRMLGKVLFHYIAVVCNTVDRIQSFLWRIDDGLLMVCYRDLMTLRFMRFRVE